MQEFGKLAVIVGLVMVVLGAVAWKSGSLGPIGRLPGDLFLQKGNATVYFPLATCLLISGILTLLAWLFRKS